MSSNIASRRSFGDPGLQYSEYQRTEEAARYERTARAIYERAVSTMLANSRADELHALVNSSIDTATGAAATEAVMALAVASIVAARIFESTLDGMLSADGLQWEVQDD